MRKWRISKNISVDSRTSRVTTRTYDKNSRMVVTASKLRENIYKILDEIVETGVPVEVTRKGVKLRINGKSRTGPSLRT